MGPPNLIEGRIQAFVKQFTHNVLYAKASYGACGPRRPKRARRSIIAPYANGVPSPVSSVRLS
jgi:hypothetical protein